jgi:hypothetical protein
MVVVVSMCMGCWERTPASTSTDTTLLLRRQTETGSVLLARYFHCTIIVTKAISLCYFTGRQRRAVSCWPCSPPPGQPGLLPLVLLGCPSWVSTRC